MTIRIFWRMNPGRNVVNLNWPALSADSAVSVQASEYAAGSQQLPDGTEQRFIGAATITVDNITPHGPPYDTNRGVTFVVNVAWSSQLNVCTDVTLLANAPQQVVWIGPRNVVGGTASGTNTSSSGTSSALDQISSQRDVGPVTYHTATIESSQNKDSPSLPMVSASLESA